MIHSKVGIALSVVKFVLNPKYIRIFILSTLDISSYNHEHGYSLYFQHSPHFLTWMHEITWWRCKRKYIYYWSAMPHVSVFFYILDKFVDDWVIFFLILIQKLKLIIFCWVRCRDYDKESERKATVEQYYRTNHINRTYEFVSI